VCTFTYFSVSLSVCILQIAGPFVFGLLLSKYDPKLCVKLAVGVMVITLPILVIIAGSISVNLSVSTSITYQIFESSAQ
jgi:hypothetical protein